MSNEAPAQVQPGPRPTGVYRWIWEGEGLLIAFCLALLMVLPLIEVIGRKVFHGGLDGASAIQQHLVLIIGLLGGMFAARDRRLLSLSTLSTFLKGRWQIFARIFSSSVAAGITVFLAVAAWQMVQMEKTDDKILAYGIPLWVVELIMPVGFAIIALRLTWHAADTWKGRLAAVLLVGLIAWIGIHPPIEAAKLVIPAILLLVSAVIFGAPIFVMLGGAALILFWGGDGGISSISVSHYSMVTKPTLPTIPLFTLAGYFLAEGGASKRLIRVFQALLGQFRGGPAIVTVLACTFFTSFTGASGVTILALGGLLMPVLISARYSERATLGILTGSGGFGLLFPPSLPLILYAIIASPIKSSGVTIEKMFLGGLLPGILLVGMAIWMGMRMRPHDNDDAPRPVFDKKEAFQAVMVAKWELLLPVIALVALFGGFATPVEAAAVTAFYAFSIETFVYRDFKGFREIPRVMAECGLLVGGVLLILGVAFGFANYLIDAQVPQQAVEWVTGAVHSKYAFLLALNICLLLIGCFMDMYSAILVVVPIIVPLGIAYGIDPIHLGIIFLTNMELGLLTPTAGVNIFLSSYRFGKPVLQISRAVIPMQCVIILGLLLITYVPPLTTFLPHLFSAAHPAAAALTR